MIASTAAGIVIADVVIGGGALAGIVLAGVVIINSVVGGGGLRARPIGAAAVLAGVELAGVVAIGLRARPIGAAAGGGAIGVRVRRGGVAGVLAAAGRVPVAVARRARLGSSGTRKRSSSCRGAACASRRRSI